ncbi:MAG: nucleotidyltransferase family protein [Oscillospiraceae bacterium]
MKTIGIVAEYNPFHLGHQWQISQIRQAMGDCRIVCCMSGNWVQRGECAVTDKWSRAEAAVRGGADLVVELPTRWAVSSAERFARGALAILAAAGVDTLCFGSECGDLQQLRQAAQCLDSGEYPAALAPFLESGGTFAAARHKAVETLLGAGADCLRGANNNLAVEYLRALPEGMDAMTFQRQGAGHDGALGEGFASAGTIRSLLRDGKTREANKLLPRHFSGEIARMELCERGILAKLRGMTAADFAALPDCSPELAGRLCSGVRKAKSLAELYTLVKTRRYTHARVRRVVLWAFLGQKGGETAEAYLRVLAMNKTGGALLRELKKTCPVPVITKPATYRDLLEEEGKSTDLYGLCFPKICECGREFTQSPRVI